MNGWPSVTPIGPVIFPGKPFRSSQSSMACLFAKSYAAYQPKNSGCNRRISQRIAGVVASQTSMATIRPANLADAAALALLAERVFRDTFASANDPGDVELYASKNFGLAVQSRELADPNLITI